MSISKAFSGLAACVCASLLALAAPTAQANPESVGTTKTECTYTLCVVSTWTRVVDANGDFAGYAWVEVSRYWLEPEDSIDPGWNP